MLENNPLVTVNILSFNRRDELQITLTKVFEQNYKNIEVIVVDNASNDGTPEMVKEKFPSVNLICLSKNIGIAGWNEGFKIAKGEYILVLDDDSYPENNCICNAIKIFDREKKCLVVSLRVYNPKWNTFEYTNEKVFNGCGALFSKKCLTEIGYFEELLFIYLHELEYSIRIYDKGFIIKQCKDCNIVHLYSATNRGENISYNYDTRKHLYFIRNKLLILITYYSFNKSLRIALKVICGGLILSIKSYHIKEFLKSLINIIKLFLTAEKKRSIIKRETENYFLDCF